MIPLSVGQKLIYSNSKNCDVIFEYLTGDDFNSSPIQKASRMVINFFDWPENKSSLYIEPFSIIEKNVKNNWLESKDSHKNPNWWWHRRRSEKLYSSLVNLEYVFAVGFTSKFGKFFPVNKDHVFSNSLVIICSDKIEEFGILNSTIHDVWAWKYCSTMGASGLRYTPSNAYETFPFPNYTSEIKELSNKLLDYLKETMLLNNLGLTSIYNAYNTFSTHKNIQTIDELRNICIELDKSILLSYSWVDIDLRHDFYEVDYLPENDRVRYTIHPEARKEVLKRLLELNHKIHEEEVAAGLWEKKKTVKKEKVVKEKKTKENTNQEKLF